ncbi:SDR family oxidoreductase [Novosphingobium sp. ZN18A2]|uniref:SDR family oxidoreductase n=1 Tax=Novosphingobium sp. ZN18A2 TaxID=3079861 RepID=UPI0030CB13F3
MAIESFEGRTAFVTGGASGIGYGIVHALAKRACFVVIADMRADHIAVALDKLKEAGLDNRVAAVELDVTDRDAYAQIAERMQAEHGGIDILVNNAGVGLEGPLTRSTFADWDFGMGVNLGGVINGILTFMPQMLAHGRGGHIVNTSSLAATTRMPGFLAIYAASKAAVLNISENLRADLGEHGIGVTALLPGWVKSNIHEAAKNRPAHLRENSGFAESEAKLGHRQVGEDWMEPEDVGELVANAILADELYVITHNVFREQMEEKCRVLLEAVPD